VSPPDGRSSGGEADRTA